MVDGAGGGPWIKDEHLNFLDSPTRIFAWNSNHHFHYHLTNYLTQKIRERERDHVRKLAAIKSANYNNESTYTWNGSWHALTGENDRYSHTHTYTHLRKKSGNTKKVLIYLRLQRRIIV